MANCPIPLFGLLLFSLPLAGAEIQGAEAVLRQIAEQVKDENPAITLKQRIKTYRLDAANLSPRQAADGWLSLLDDYLKLAPAMPRNEFGYPQIQIERLAAALPPSTSWDALIAALDARTADKNDPLSASLRLLSIALRADPADRDQQLIAAVEKLLTEAPDTALPVTVQAPPKPSWID